MPYFEWDEGLRTGHDLVDDQHLGLFALANALHEAVAEDRDDPQIIADAVYRLTDYVVDHFAAEEELMAQVGYPEAGVHKALHDHLTTETLGLAARYFGGGDVRADAIAGFVADWLRDHIRSDDMRAVAFVRERREGTG